MPIDASDALTAISVHKASEASKGPIERLKEFFSELKNSFNNPVTAFEVFESNLVFLKSFGVSLLILLAIVNYLSYKNVGLISEKPGLFAAESAVFGLSGVVPFVMLCFLRGGRFDTKQIATFSVVLFVVFFILNYVLEMGGLYAATFYEQTEEKAKAEEEARKIEEANMSYMDKLKSSLSKTSNIVLLIVFGSSIICMLFAAACVKDLRPEYARFKGVSPYIIFAVEMLLFGVISAVPIFFMASNRNALSSHTTKEFLLITAKFAALHCVLQASGFYTYLFTGSHFTGPALGAVTGEKKASFGKRR
jgi:hypothetical protein